MTFLAWRFRVSEAAIARRVEGACSKAQNILISAVQFDRALAADSPMRRALFEEMSDPFPQVRWTDVFDSKLLQKLALALLGTFLAVVFWAVISPNYFVNSAARMFLPASNIAPLTRTKILDIQPGNARIIHGADFSLTVKLGGEVPGAAWIVFREVGSGWQRKPMNREMDLPVFSFAWKDVRQPMDYYITAGDAVSPSHRVSVRPKTAIRAKAAEIQWPAYTQRRNETVQDFTTLQHVLPGSRVTVTMEFNYPLAELKAVNDSDQLLAVQRLGDTRWRVADTILANRTLRLSYRDVDQFTDHEQLSITTKADEPPIINISDPPEGKELLAPRDATLTIKFLITDNHGLGSVALYKSTSEAQEGLLVQEWKDAAGQPSFSGSAQVPLKRYAQSGDERVAFCIVARDQNNITGPGATISRPIVARLRAAEKVQDPVDDLAAKLQKNLEDLIKLQRTNLEETRAVARAKPPTAEGITPLMNRQAQVGDLASSLAMAADVIAPKVRQQLQALVQGEMKEAVLALRNAVAAADTAKPKFLARAIELQVIILARLEGAPESVNMEAEKNKVADMVSALEDLLKKQRDLYRETTNASVAQAKALADKQDTLGQQAVRVRKNLEANVDCAPLDDKETAAVLEKVSRHFGAPVLAAIQQMQKEARDKKMTLKLPAVVAKVFVQVRVYEDMLTAADKLGSAKLPEAVAAQKQILLNLSNLIDILNDWMVGRADKKADELKDKLNKLRAKLDKLHAIQRDIVEKSRDLARKDQFNPDDKATCKQIKESKDLMAQVIEQMTLDLQAFPEMKPSNDLKVELMTIHEDVIQADKEEAKAGTLTPREMPVQKEDGILQAIENAKEVSEDLEMWLPTTLEREKWLQENFDVAEMPEIPNLPLPDRVEDLVGNLLEEQAGLAEQVTDAASNQALAQNPANGWDVRDGQMPGFAAQGRSGNERPNHNEQMGRSTGGREGMSDGEMVGEVAKNLQGDTPDVRRTRDPFQQGKVKDEDGPSATRATGGGKAGAFSDRLGMSGNAPLRDSEAPRRLAADAVAVQQALLAQKTSKLYAQASLLYLRADGMSEVAQLMDQSSEALRDGRLRDFEGLHQRIVRQLQNVRTRIAGGEVVAMPSGDAARATDKQLMGGSEGEAPQQYKDMVADYYRSLTEER
jgi:hypothetical protein